MPKKTPDDNFDGLEEQTAATVAADETSANEAAVDAIIRKRVYAAIGIGFVPIPLVDFLGLSALQLELIHALAKAHGVEFKKERVKSIISSLCGGALTTVSIPFAASLFKSIPIIGTTAGAATICIMGGATTYALGWVFDRHFRNGGTLADFDAKEAKAYFKTKLEEGKALVGKMKQAVKKDAAAAEEEAKKEAEAATTA